MTLTKFQRLLKKISPKLTIRRGGRNDVAGLFVGRFGKEGYIARMTKGELTMNGYRYQLPDPNNPMEYVSGPIQKRGRKTLINLLRNYGWARTHQQRSMLTWGIER